MLLEFSVWGLIGVRRIRFVFGFTIGPVAERL